MSKRQEKGRLAPFVPYLKETMREPAWKIMSMGARLLYLHLKARYNLQSHNNGRLYLPTRMASEELGNANLRCIGRWFRELQHYGWIVMMEAGALGVEGKGRAPRWRLTELGYMKDPPTRDYTRWQGDLFVDQKPVRRKQNPDGTKAIRVMAQRQSPVMAQVPSVSPASDGTKAIKGNDPSDGTTAIKSSLTTRLGRAGSELGEGACEAQAVLPPPHAPILPSGHLPIHPIFEPSHCRRGKKRRSERVSVCLSAVISSAV
jgi:hypothetical protein